MKRAKNLFCKIHDIDNLYKAYLLARRSKRYRMEVLKFTERLPEELESIRNDIINKTYKVGEYKVFKVYEPKERNIMALPFRDRVVQHAINNIVEDCITNKLIRHTYACVRGRGTHAASYTLRTWMKNVDTNLYYLKCDIHKYFPSINNRILKEYIDNIIKCRDTKNLIYSIIDSNENGIPIGNLTSQVLANLYLSKLDNYVSNELGFRRYIRYMDDFIIFGYDKDELRNLLNLIIMYTDRELDVKLNHKTKISPIYKGVDFVGYVHYKNKVNIRRSTYIRLKKHIKQNADGVNNILSIVSLVGMLGHITNKKLYDNYKEKYRIS